MPVHRIALGDPSIFYHQIKTKTKQKITLKSHEPDKNLTCIQRCLEKYICNLSQQQIFCPINLMFKILSRTSHKPLALQSQSASDLLLIVIVDIFVILCCYGGPDGELASFLASSRFLVLYFIWLLIPMCPCLECFTNSVSLSKSYYLNLIWT